MRNVTGILILALSIALAVAGCSRPSAERAPVPAAEPQAFLTCQPPFRSCTNCAGRPICAIQCPACPPPLAQQPETSAATQSGNLVCRPPQRRCLACDGTLFCSTGQCPECPAPLAPQPDEPPAPVADLVCKPPLRQCTSCNGLTRFCGRLCPECAPLLAPRPEQPTAIADLTVGGERCGGVICGLGLHCCNPTCNLCTPKGVECTQQTCN